MSVPGLLHACGRIFWKLKTVLKRIFLFFAIWIGTWDLQTWTTFVKIFCIVILAEKKLYTFLLLAFLTIILWNSFISDFVFKFTLNTEPKRKKKCRRKNGMKLFLKKFSYFHLTAFKWFFFCKILANKIEGLYYYATIKNAPAKLIFQEFQSCSINIIFQGRHLIYQMKPNVCFFMLQPWVFSGWVATLLFSG